MHSILTLQLLSCWAAAFNAASIPTSGAIPVKGQAYNL